MNITMMKAKIHRATVTQCDLNYEGSITIDSNLLEQSGILPYEQVDVLNINTGQRFTTYAIEGERESGIIGINGAAARLAQKGDLVIVCAYAAMSDVEAKSFVPKVLLMNEHNISQFKKAT
jgi:aspartate 1-decarboxylase